MKIPVDPAIMLDDLIVLNEFLEGGDEDELIEGITAFREEYPANFYAFTELDPSLVTESLLTRVEFETYFGGAYD